MGCKKVQRVLLVDEEKVTEANLGNKIFWKLLGSSQTHTKALEVAGPPEEDENYEIEVNLKQSICAVVRFTLAHCAGLHTLCREGVQGNFVGNVRCFSVNTRCGVCKK